MALVVNIVRLAWWRQFRQDDFEFVLVPVILLLFGYTLFRQLVLDVVDEVIDEGDSLLCRKGGVNERISFSNVINVNYSGMQSPQRITLTLRDPSRFGRTVSFIPPFRLFCFSAHPIAEMLIERAVNARSQLNG